VCRGRSGVWAVNRPESLQSTAMVKFIHAVKPPLCAMVGSHQSTYRSLDSQRSGAGSFTLATRSYAPWSAPVSQQASAWTGGWQVHGQGTIRRLNRRQAGVWVGVCQGLGSGLTGLWQSTGMVRFIYTVKPSVCVMVGSRQSTGMSLGMGQAEDWTGGRLESGQSQDMVRFIHAGKPTVCSAVSSRQSTGRSMDRSLAGVWTGNRQESEQSTVIVRFTYAGKPTVCAIVGSSQSTGRSLDRG
jgi:hypothetical protein